MMPRMVWAALLLWPALAWADPATLIGLASTFASAAGYATVATYLAIAAVVVGAANARRKQRKAAAQARAQYNAGLEDRSVSLLQALPPWRVVYGRCITGGDIVAIFASDKTSTRASGVTYTRPDAYKHLVIVFAAHQCQAINELYIDGSPVGTLDGSGFPTGGAFYSTEVQFREVALASGASTTQPYAVTVLSCVLANPPDTTTPAAASYTVTGGGLTINNTSGAAAVVVFSMPVPKPVVRISKALGSDTQTVNAYLNGVVPTQWTANHRLRGLCYAVITLDLEDARFQGGPPNITADISGKLVLDTRTATTAWSANPALIVRDFLASPWGYECAAGDIDSAYCNAAANACDVAISLDVGGVVTAGQPTYTCNGAFTTEASREAVLEDLVESMAGFAVYGATWQIIAGAWTAPVMDLTDADVMGQIEVLQADAGMQDAYNGVRGVYIPAGKAVPSEIDAYQNAAFLAADGVALWSDISLPWTDNKARARNLSRVFVERARNALVVRVPARFRAWPLQVGDRVRLSSTEYGWTLKNFRVTDWQFGTTSPVLLTLQEDEAAAYDLADAATADPSPNSNLPNPWSVATPGSVAAASGTAHLIKLPDGTIETRVRITWTAITDAYVADGTGQVQVLWRRMARDPADVFQRVVVSGNETSAYITGVSAFDLLAIQVQAINGLGVRSSPAVLVHQVVGKSAVPVNVAGLAATIVQGGARISWNDNTEVDYESTELRFGASWAAGTRLFRGNGSNWTWLSPAQATYTVWAKHFDTTGNESATAVSVSVVIDAAALVIIGAGQFTGTIGSANLLTNSSFQADSNGDGTADGWTNYANGTTGTITRSLVSGSSLDGRNRQRIVAAGLGTGGTDRAGIEQAFSVGGQAGRPYVFSAYLHDVSNSSEGVRLYLEFRDIANAIITTAQNAGGGVTSVALTRYSLAGTVPAGTVSANVFIWAENRPTVGAVTLDIDHAQFEIGDVITGYAPRADEIIAGAVGTVELAANAATEPVLVSASAPTYTGGSSGSVGGYIGLLCQAAWTNSTGQTVYVECTVDNGGSRSSASGGVYLFNTAGLSAGATGGTLNGDLLLDTNSTEISTSPGRRVSVFGVSVPNGSTVYAEAFAVVVSQSPVVSVLGNNITCRIAAIKR